MPDNPLLTEATRAFEIGGFSSYVDYAVALRDARSVVEEEGFGGYVERAVEARDSGAWMKDPKYNRPRVPEAVVTLPPAPTAVATPPRAPIAVERVSDAPLSDPHKEQKHLRRVMEREEQVEPLPRPVVDEAQAEEEVEDTWYEDVLWGVGDLVTGGKLGLVRKGIDLLTGGGSVPTEVVGRETHETAIEELTGALVEEVLLPVDIKINEVLGGDPGETVSARVGRREGPVSQVIAGALDTVDPGHTQRALARVPTNTLPCVPDWLQRRIAREMKRGRIPCVLEAFR